MIGSSILLKFPLNGVSISVYFSCLWINEYLNYEKFSFSNSSSLLSHPFYFIITNNATLYDTSPVSKQASNGLIKAWARAREHIKLASVRAQKMLEGGFGKEDKMWRW